MFLLGAVGSLLDSRLYLSVDLLAAQVMLYSEEDRNPHSDDSCGAQDQDDEQNFDHHRLSGYQNVRPQAVGFVVASRSLCPSVYFLAL